MRGNFQTVFRVKICNEKIVVRFHTKRFRMLIAQGIFCILDLCIKYNRKIFRTKINDLFAHIEFAFHAAENPKFFRVINF